MLTGPPIPIWKSKRHVNCTPIVLQLFFSNVIGLNPRDSEGAEHKVVPHHDFISRWNQLFFNCAQVLLYCAGPISSNEGGGDFRNTTIHSEIRCTNGLDQLGLNSAQFCSKHFLLYEPCFRDMGAFFQYVRIRLTAKVHLPSPFHCTFRSSNILFSLSLSVSKFSVILMRWSPERIGPSREYS